MRDEELTTTLHDTQSWSGGCWLSCQSDWTIWPLLSWRCAHYLMLPGLGALVPRYCCSAWHSSSIGDIKLQSCFGRKTKPPPKSTALLKSLFGGAPSSGIATRRPFTWQHKHLLEQAWQMDGKVAKSLGQDFLSSSPLSIVHNRLRDLFGLFH